METDTIREAEASVIWRELDKEINMLRTLLEDLERRAGRGALAYPVRPPGYRAFGRTCGGDS